MDRTEPQSPQTSQSDRLHLTPSPATREMGHSEGQERTWEKRLPRNRESLLCIITHTYPCTLTHACTHTPIHTCTQTHTHICACAPGNKVSQNCTLLLHVKSSGILSFLFFFLSFKTCCSKPSEQIFYSLMGYVPEF
jgi:hypothetical protein